MTTWAFNVLRELLAAEQVLTVWIEANSAEETRFCQSPGIVLGKCHHFSEPLADAADLIVYSYRDLRTAAVSFRRKFGAAPQVEDWLEAMDRWMPRADAVLRYESVVVDKLAGVQTLRSLLSAADADAAVTVDTTDSAGILRRVDGKFEDRQLDREVRYDENTMILSNHRTFQPRPDQLKNQDRQVFDFVQSEFSTWLEQHGYLGDGDAGAYGQEAEYRIASVVLSALAGGVVVDVGVEKGSFIDLACRSGARAVIGFEPLPRHLEFLGKRFGANQQVTIHPLAVSNATAVAKFHVAIDHDGKELDYHHTLADLGDSATVLRSRRSIEVNTAALRDLVRDGAVPGEIAFLKIDTDGHDLAVLEGLGEVRPQVIMAEFWDTLPQTSGDTPYSLRDLAAWAQAGGYGQPLVVRRHGQAELIEWGAPWTVPGDWGNVFFFRPEFDLDAIRGQLDEISAQCYAQLCRHLHELTRSGEEKEAVIQQLAGSHPAATPVAPAAITLTAEHAQAGPAMVEAHQDKTAAEPITPEDVLRLQRELMAKEQVIRGLHQAVQAYRAAMLFVRPVAPLWRGASGMAQLLKPKLGRLHHHEPLRAVFPPVRALNPQTQAPTISIVTPSFRQAGFLGRTIDSVLDQRYPQLEYFVQDGGSTDGSVEILQDYSQRLTGWVSAPDGGQSHAINAGFARTSGSIMAWLNSDDLLLPGALATVAEYFVAHPEVDVVYGHRILIDEQDREIGRWVLPEHDDAVLSWADFIPQETLFWRRSLWEKVGGIDESFKFAMDWDLLLRFRDAGAHMVRLPHFLGAFRIHQAQKTSAVINEVGMQEMDRLRLRVLGRQVSRPEIGRALLPYLVRHIGHDLAFRIRRRLGRVA